MPYQTGLNSYGKLGVNRRGVELWKLSNRTSMLLAADHFMRLDKREVLTELYRGAQDLPP